MQVCLTIAVAAAGMVAGSVYGQSFNIDFGPDGVAPGDAYAAAGRPGHWISIPGTQGVTVFNLVDVDDVQTAVSMSQFGGTETLNLPDPSVAGTDARLMEDCLVTHSEIESCLFFNNVQPGNYELIIYAWMPNQPGILQVTNVDEEPGNPHYTVGGNWPGGHAELVTYARHLAQVSSPGATPGLLRGHSGVPLGGNFAVGAALNGVQIHKLKPGDLDANDVVDAVDFLQLLAAWGSCSGCLEDLDLNGVVDTLDFLELLANWGPA